MSLTFHETFSLDLGNLSRLLEIVSDNPEISNDEIQLETGMGNRKVEPTVRYAAYCNLLDRAPGSKEFSVTKFGKVVLEFDKYFVSPVTHWALHYHLSNPTTGATAWSFFIYTFLPGNNEFTRAKLRSDLETVNPDLKKSSMDKNIAPLLNSYLSSDGLKKIKVFSETSQGTFSREASALPNTYVAAYILAEIWDRHYGSNRMGIGHDILFADGYFGAAMNMNQEETQKCLNDLSSLNLIEQMREAPPHQVVPKWGNKFDLLRTAYSDG